MQTQFGGSVTAGPAQLNLTGGGPVAVEAAPGTAAAEYTPSTTGAEQPAIAKADNTSIHAMPLWALALRQGVELPDAGDPGRVAKFEETFALKAAGTAEAAPPLPTVSPMMVPDSADASSTLPRPEPPWANFLSQ